MAIGDWPTGTLIVVDNLTVLYISTANPPLMGAIVATWRALLPTGNFADPQTSVAPVALGVTSRSIATQLAVVLAYIKLTQGLVP